MVLATSQGVLAAPGGGGGGSGPSFTVSPSTLSFSTVTGTVAYDLVTVTTNKAIVLVNPASASDPHFADTQAGSCWQLYGAFGNKIPKDTSCTIQVGFVSATPGTFTGTLTVTQCLKWHLNAFGGIECEKTDGFLTVDLSGTATTPPLPDLTVDSIAFTTPQNYTVTVENAGNASADVSSVVVQGYYSADNILDAADTGACGVTMTGSLAAGATTDVNIPCGTGPAAGDNYLIVVLDPTHALVESDEANNVGVAPLPNLPDLTVTSVDILGANGNYPWNYVVTIQNVGRAPLVSERIIRVQGWYSVDQLVDIADTPACGEYFGAEPGVILLPGQTAQVLIGCTARPTAGHNYLVAEVDALSVVTESNEGNNVGYRVLPEIDLTVENIVIDGITASQVDYTVTIGLTQLATSSPVTVEMQGVGVVGSYSTDGVVGTNPACNVFQAASLIIAPGSTFNLHVTCPSLPSPGETFLIVRIDSANVIAEFDELNNVESTTLP